MPGPVCSAACSVASPISQASGISATRREHEQGRVPDVGQVVERDDDRPEGQAGEEDSSDHGRATTLPAAPIRVGARDRAQPENRLFVKSCGGWTAAVTIRGMTDRLAADDSRRAAAAPAGRGRVPPLRGALRQGRLPRCVRRAGLRVRLRLRGVRPHVHGLHAAGVRRRDRPRPAARGRAPPRRLRRRRRAPDAAADVPRRGGVVLRAARRRGRLPEPGVPRDARREPELPRLRAARRRLPEAATRRAAGRPRLRAASSARVQLAQVGPPRPRRARGRPGPASRGSRAAPGTRDAPRNVREPARRSARRRSSSCRSRFEPSGAFESLTCRQRSRSSPIRSSRSASAAASDGRVGDVDAGDVPVARVEAEAEPRVVVERRRGSPRARRSSGRSCRRRRPSSPCSSQRSSVVSSRSSRSAGTTRSSPASKPAPRCEPTWKTTPSAPIAAAASSVARSAATRLLVDRPGRARRG